jgi:hypothetical protein
MENERDIRNPYAWIHRRSALVLSIIVAIVRLCAGNAGAGDAGLRIQEPAEQGQVIHSIPFEEMNGTDVYNASGIVPLGDSRFLFCDNNTGDKLFELNLTPEGKKNGPLIPRPLEGLAPDSIDDLESMTIAKGKERRFLFAASSLYIKKPKNDNPPKIPPSGLLRIRIRQKNQLRAENMPGFRDWFIQNSPGLADSSKLSPDEGGLNIEGLAWDKKRDALLFGLRTPVSDGKVTLIPVRVKKLNGPWTTDNLSMLAPIKLTLEPGSEPQGIRGMEYIAARKSFLIIVGKAISGTNAPYALYEWNGKPEGPEGGTMRRLKVTFAPKMKPESLTSGTVGGKPSLIFVDDGGGFQVVGFDRLLGW